MARKSKLNCIKNQQNSVSGCTESFTLMISFEFFFMNYQRVSQGIGEVVLR